MQHLLHPDQDEVQRILDQNIYCPSLQASISPQQCRTNQERAQKIGWNDRLNIFAYEPCLQCNGTGDTILGQSNSRERKRKCNRCGRIKSLQSYYTNPETGQLYQVCRTCRSQQHEREKRQKKPTLREQLIASVTQDASTILFNRLSVTTLELYKFQFVQFLPKPLRIIPLLEKREEPFVCKITRKNSNRGYSYTASIAKVAKHFGIPAHTMFTLEQRKDGAILLNSESG